MVLLSIFIPAVGFGMTDIPDRTSSCDAQPIQKTDTTVSVEKLISESSQILLVRNMNPASVDVQVIVLEKKNGRWQILFDPMNGVIGRNGFAPPGEKREGDGRTPSGTFSLGVVFGYAPAVSTKMPYRQATDDDLWVDDVHADDYNQWVKRSATKASSFETMRRIDDLYKFGIVVEYNTNPVVKGYGSAIFVHIWQGKGLSTSGCIALPEEDILKILQWLNPAAKPLIVMGTNVTVGEF